VETRRVSFASRRSESPRVDIGLHEFDRPIVAVDEAFFRCATEAQ
jgi:hypothetical protein